jgi:DNA-binding transcriptional regulator LsrR (DeoR family)
LNQIPSAVTVDEEAALAARAAWLHFAGGKTQGEVAELLGVQSTKAHRLIARARSEGLIRVFVEGPIAGCIELEERLKAMHGLAHCEVVPNIDEGGLPLRTLGMAGARYIRNLIESGRHQMIGFGHGRTLAAAVDLMASVDGKGTKFVSLLGGLTRRFAASPFDVIHKLAERTSAEAYVMPVPFFANSAKDRQVLEAQYGVSDVIAMARMADLYIAGIGEVTRASFIASAGMLDAEDIDEVMKTGARAELLGQFFLSDGSPLTSGIGERALAPRIADLKSHKIVALAGGTSKAQAIKAILASRLLHGLITDEATARDLIATTPATQAGRKTSREKHT